MVKKEMELERELEFCNEVMHDMEHKLEDAYMEENTKEIKRCQEALKTLDKEFFKIKYEMNHQVH